MASLTSLGPTFLVASLAVLVAMPPVRRLAWRWGFVDQPAGHKAHHVATPMLGGAVLVVAVSLGLVTAAVSNTSDGDGWWRALLAGLVLAVLGGWDDRQPLPIGFRLAVQVLVAVALVWSGMRLGGMPPTLAVVVTVAWLLIMTNALNLLDNMDGVATTVAAIAGFGFLVLGAGAPAAALAGACLAFLWFNRPTAQVFLGDAGSLPLGLWLGILGIEVASGRGSVMAGVLPILVLAVPLFDTALVSLSRLRRGLNPMTTPGLDHVAHRLGRLGLGRWSVLLTLATCGTLGAVVAVVLDRSDASPPVVGLVSLVLCAVAAMATVLLERPRPLGVVTQAREESSR